MRDVAIIGAGELGGACAHQLARANIVRRVTLIDDAGRAAEGKALDISQAAPIEAFATRVEGSTDLTRAAGAAIVIVADRLSNGGEWRAEDGLLLLRRLERAAPRAVIVCAGATERELIDAAVRELKVPRQRLFGTAPEALAAAACALIALAVDGSPRDVAVSILGVPPAHTVIGWEDASVAGVSVVRTLSDPIRRNIAARVAALWPPGPQALAAAAVRAIACIEGRSRRRASCFVAPDTAAGVRTRTGALPVRLGPFGISEFIEPSLNPAERIALENAMNV